jgi:hypothetical protein
MFNYENSSYDDLQEKIKRHGSQIQQIVVSKAMFRVLKFKDSARLKRTSIFRKEYMYCGHRLIIMDYVHLYYVALRRSFIKYTGEE